MGHFPEDWVPAQLKALPARPAVPPAKAMPKAEAGKLPAVPVRRQLVAVAKAGTVLPPAPAPLQGLGGPMKGVQALVAKFGCRGPPPKLGALQALFGPLPPLGGAVAEALPCAPVEKAAPADKKGKKDKDKKTKRRKSKNKKVVNELLLHRARGKEDDDSSDGSSSSSEDSGVQKKSSKKKKGKKGDN